MPPDTQSAAELAKAFSPGGGLHTEEQSAFEGMEPWHGKISGYNKRGCRCELCKAAARAESRRKTKRRMKAPPRGPIHPADYTGPCFRCSYCSHWRPRINGETLASCPYCEVAMALGNRVPPVATSARGTWAEDL